MAENQAESHVLANMATVSAPSEFNFSLPGSWNQWKKRLQRYMSVSGFINKPEAEKMDMLVYLMGAEAEEIITQFNLTPAQQVYSIIIEKFDAHFIPQKNVIFKRFKFNTPSQQPGESVDAYITALHSLAEHCSYGALKDELIRDRIVVGVLDVKVSERLQLQKNLILGEAVLTLRQAELQNSQNKILRQERVQEVPTVNAHRGNYWSQSQAEPNKYGQQNTQGKSNKNYKCTYCSVPSCNSRERCPAKESRCRLCGKKGHWQARCRSGRNVRVVQGQNCAESEVGIENEIENLQVNNFDFHLRHIYIYDNDQWFAKVSFS
ncbi:uncharacterized protein LOC126891558 [Diabrotica virgifera virgifera]|uniref:CCHC-type domain-containing protein n=1 Tax=Diabrotica virgifera virgifera TaxID=50390 RepID=A0ABM5L2M3_DIAVI|nr:uncharacterized protein LOC126891558 [Diabrotica virgifera virgifera]